MGRGGMSHPLKTVRFILVSINVIVFLVGAILLAEGIDLLITRRFHSFAEFISNIKDQNTTKNKIFSEEALYLFNIVPGVMLVSVGFFGCSGAITQIQCLLFCSSSLVGILLAFQTVLIASLIAFRNQLKERLTLAVQVFLHDQYKGPLEQNPPLSSFLWDYTMYQFKCCGISGKDNFDLTSAWNRTNPWWNRSMTIGDRSFRYPLTCCPLDSPLSKQKKVFAHLLSCAIDGRDIHEMNCYKKVVEWFHSHEAMILTAMVVIVIVEMVALTFVLVIHDRKRTTRGYHIVEQLPPPYTPRRRTANNRFQIVL